jgi:serine/threonine protein kinase
LGSDYLGFDTFLRDRPYVLNIIRPEQLSEEDSPEVVAERFQKAALSAASIRHPNVLDIIDFGKSPDGPFYLVKEYVEGQTLHRILRREMTLNASRTLSILIQAASGIAAAHERGILHLDLKPSAILVIQTRRKSAEEWDNELVKVSDFNFASWTNDGRFEYRVVGTPIYTAPEQISMNCKLDVRTDIYALGGIGYEMLCGHPPFTGDLMSLLAQKATTKPPPLRTLRSEIPFSLDRVVMQALELNQKDRPANMSDWLEELESVRSQINKAGADEVRQDAGKAGDGPSGPAQNYDVFISYRREGSSEAARAIRAELRQHGVRVFLDVDELRSGHFDQALLDCIARTSNFIVILASHCLDRCVEERDWLRQEIVQAIKLNKNIIPIAMPGFDFPLAEQLPADLRALQAHQRVRYDHEYFDAMIKRILSYLRMTDKG